MNFQPLKRNFSSAKILESLENLSKDLNTKKSRKFILKYRPTPKFQTFPSKNFRSPVPHSSYSQHFSLTCSHCAATKLLLFVLAFQVWREGFNYYCCCLLLLNAISIQRVLLNARFFPFFNFI